MTKFILLASNLSLASLSFGRGNTALGFAVLAVALGCFTLSCVFSALAKDEDEDEDEDETEEAV
jgi:hypothetical protein